MFLFHDSWGFEMFLLNVDLIEICNFRSIISTKQVLEIIFTF